MDNQKTLLVKSKSSNSTSDAKRTSQKNEKTSKSAEFQLKTTMYGTQPLMHRKRGVYVEKKPIKIFINNTEPSSDVPHNQPAARPRPIPRPSKKRFLTSVLTILSKSTAGTQYPDDTEAIRKMDKIRLQIKREEEDIRDECNLSQNVAKRKTKIYKSRILNNHANRESVTVLQSKKDIAITSSECMAVKLDASSVNPGTVKWAESLLRRNDSHESVASHSKKVKLVAKDSKPSAIAKDKVNDKSFCDFFVDIMKTTNVYNLDVETERGTQNWPASGNSSKITLLEIKRSVAKNKKQPKVEEKKSQTLVISPKPSSQRVYSVKPEEKDEWTKKQFLEQFQSQMKQQKSNKPAAPSTNKKRKIKSDSFQHKKTNSLPNTISLPMPSKKKPSKKDPKKDFLKVLKEELQKKADTYEEPENFYQALKVIARNKRRNQEWKNDVPSEEEDHVCQFKRRRVFSRKSSAKQPSYYVEPSSSARTTYIPVSPTYRKQKRIIIKHQHPQRQLGNLSDYSNHSLEVVGYDYAKPSGRKPLISPTLSFPSVQEDLTPHPPKNDIEDYSSDFWDDYSHSETSTMIEQRQYVLEKFGQF